ncbi:MAG: 30S ribosomal protein S9 [Patescibacteria group bacterium]
MPKTTAKKTSAPKKTTTKTATPKAAPKKATKAPKAIKAVKESKVVAAEKAPVKAAPREKLGNYFYASGKRKTSVASVRMFSDGKGIVTVNERTFENYFPVSTDQDKILSPLRVTNHLKSFDITVKVHGGGIHSQAEAIRHGISKALLAVDAATRSILKPLGFLTRDSRIKERKKYGLKRARRAPQWQKR